MSSNNYKIEELRLKLKTATKLKLKNEKNVYLLRSTELNLSEELTLIRREIEFASQQLEDVKEQISQMNYQNAMIVICSESENSKTESYRAIINNHKNVLMHCLQKREQFELQQKELREKQAEKDELERQKHAKALEINDQKAKEIAVIEDESEKIERECNILRLRRKLIDAEETRRILMTKSLKF